MKQGRDKVTSKAPILMGRTPTGEWEFLSECDDLDVTLSNPVFLYGVVLKPLSVDNLSATFYDKVILCKYVITPSVEHISSDKLYFDDKLNIIPFSKGILPKNSSFFVEVSTLFSR